MEMITQIVKTLLPLLPAPRCTPKTDRARSKSRTSKKKPAVVMTEAEVVMTDDSDEEKSDDVAPNTPQAAEPTDFATAMQVLQGLCANLAAARMPERKDGGEEDA